MTQLIITGYENDADGEINCEHCGRGLKHGIRISDGRLVGAACLNKQLTKPKQHQGKAYRIGPALIVKAAKCVQFAPEHRWATYGVNKHTITFEAA